MLEGFLEVGLSLVTMGLLFLMFMRFCGVGIITAILGAILSLFFKDSSAETFAWWGFGIGMVYQTIMAWREMLPVIVLTAIGLGVGLLVSMGLQHMGVSMMFSKMSTLWCLIAFVYLGSSWMSEYINEVLKSDNRVSSSRNEYYNNSINETKKENHRCNTCIFFNCTECNHYDIKVGPSDGINCDWYIYG